jgi:hypothetical protein
MQPATVTRGAEGLSFPNAVAVVARFLDDLARMRAATEAGASAGALDPALPVQFARAAAIAGDLPHDGDTLPPGLVSALSQPPRDGRDSLHGLVMDMHRALNTITAGLAEADIAGARVFHLAATGRDRVRAFMRGLNRTAPLKFNHPGLATNAACDGRRLVIRNDIGATDAHVLIAYVAGLRLSVTYSDIHRRAIGSSAISSKLPPRQVASMSCCRARWAGAAPSTSRRKRCASRANNSCKGARRLPSATSCGPNFWRASPPSPTGFLISPPIMRH